MLVLDVGAPDGPSLRKLCWHCTILMVSYMLTGLGVSTQGQLLSNQICRTISKNPQKIRPKIRRFQHAGLESH